MILVCRNRHDAKNVAQISYPNKQTLYLTQQRLNTTRKKHFSNFNKYPKICSHVSHTHLIQKPTNLPQDMTVKDIEANRIYRPAGSDGRFYLHLNFVISKSNSNFTNIFNFSLSKGSFSTI